MSPAVTSPTGWWRVVLGDGTLWSESSSEQENRQALRSAPPDSEPRLQRMMARTESWWEDAHD